MTLERTVDALTSPDLADDDYGALLDAVETVNLNPSANIPHVLRLIKAKLQSGNGNTILRTLTLLDFVGENCGARARVEIADESFINEALVPIIDNVRMHVSVKYQAIKEMYKLAQSFGHDESLAAMARAFSNAKSRFPDLASQAEGEVSGGGRNRVAPVTDGDEEFMRAVELSLKEQELHKTAPVPRLEVTPVQAGPPAQTMQMPMQPMQPLQQQPTQQTQSMQPTQQPLQSQYTQSWSQQSHQGPTGNAPASPMAPQMSGSSSHSFLQSLLQESANAPAKVIALFPLTSNDEDTLSFEKDDIITVVENINADWLRGCLHGNAGIVPVNYVKPIPKTNEDDLKDLIKTLDSSFDIESTLSKLLDLNRKLKTTPMTSQQFESCLLDNKFPTKIQNMELLKTSFKKVLELHRVKLLELEAIKSNIDASLQTYQGMITEAAPAPQDPSIAQFIQSYPDIGSLSLNTQPQAPGP